MGGYIEYFKLTSWWLSAFSEDERRHIVQTFQPLGSSGDALTSGKILDTSESAVSLLNSLAGWFTKSQDRSIAHRMLSKAAELAQQGNRVLDVHFLCGQQIAIYYRDRENKEFLDKAIEACKKQISIAAEAAKAFRSEYRGSPLPSHQGYEQLAIIYEKQGSFQEVIELCNQARAHGWAGNWKSRIDRCKKKLAKI